MKIHIVQKGDTLWDIAKQYGVDFNELQALNTQLSSPDMIMPGMKIKVPSNSKQVKEKKHSKETKKHVKEQPKPISPKPLSVKEDDHKKPKEVKKEMPKVEPKEKQQMPQMPLVPPMMETPMYEQPMEAPLPKQEMPKEQPVKEKAKEKVKEKQEIPKMPEMPQMEMPPMQQQPMPMVPVPMCCHATHSCCCKFHHQQMLPQCNCHDMGHMHMQQSMPCHQQSYSGVPMQHRPANEGLQQGINEQWNPQKNHVTQYPIKNEQQINYQRQPLQPYPPFYRSTPQNPPQPAPPEFPAMSAHGTGENDS